MIQIEKLDEATIKKFNERQQSSKFHPYTCGNDSSHILEARIDGLYCPKCDYKQTWMHS